MSNGFITQNSLIIYEIKEYSTYFVCLRIRHYFLKLVSRTINDILQQETKIPMEQKGKLMKDMGQLWLKAEVRELETKMKRTSTLPPYLVLDCDALIYHIPLVKQLVYSKKFIILVPSVGVYHIPNHFKPAILKFCIENSDQQFF